MIILNRQLIISQNSFVYNFIHTKTDFPSLTSALRVTLGKSAPSIVVVRSMKKFTEKIVNQTTKNAGAELFSTGVSSSRTPVHSSATTSPIYQRFRSKSEDNSLLEDHEDNDDVNVYPRLRSMSFEGYFKSLRTNCVPYVSLKQRYYNTNSAVLTKINSTEGEITLSNNTNIVEGLSSLNLNTISERDVISTLAYLPLSYPIQDSVSGIMPLTKKQREILNSDTSLGAEMRLFIKKKMIHITYNFLQKKSNVFSENIYQAIKGIFSSTTEQEMSKDMFTILGKNLIPLTQSLCVFFFGNATFSFDTFKELCDRFDIKCDSFKEEKIKISHFIELYYVRMLKKTITKFTSFKGDYHLVHPEGFRNMAVYFNELDSKDRTGQKHCDLLIIEKNADKVSGELLKMYFDVKTFVSFSTEHCRFSLFHSTIPALRKYISDIPLAIQNYMKKHPESSTGPINTLYSQLSTIKDSKSKGTNLSDLTSKFSDLLEVIVNASVEKDFQNLKLSFAVDAGKDIDYITFYNTVIKPHLEKIEDVTTTINNMMPEKSMINKDNHVLTMSEFITKVLPDEMKENAKIYLENIILPKITS